MKADLQGARADWTGEDASVSAAQIRVTSKTRVFRRGEGGAGCTKAQALVSCYFLQIAKSPAEPLFLPGSIV